MPLREEPHQELPLLAAAEGGGDDGVLAGRQHQPQAHLPQVNILVSLAHRLVTAGEPCVHLANPGLKLNNNIKHFISILELPAILNRARYPRRPLLQI